MVQGVLHQHAEGACYIWHQLYMYIAQWTTSLKRMRGVPSGSTSQRMNQATSKEFF